MIIFFEFRALVSSKLINVILGMGACHRSILGILASLTLCLSVSPARAESPPVLPPLPPVEPGASWMFDPSVVVDVNIELPQSSIDQLPTQMEQERLYVPATFTMTHTREDQLLRSYGPWEVTLKVKGMYGSFRNLPAGEKAGLKIKFPKGSRPDGLKKLTLNNMVQDGSMVREVLAYHVFREMGIAAPRTGYARVTINGVYYGIYLNLETMDDVALPRWYPETSHLYEGSYGNWWGDMADPFSGHYEVDEGDEEDRSDLAKLIEVSRSERKGWLARMNKVADLEQMAMMWACEWFTGHWDGYSQHLPNNYYLHADAKGRFTMLPWGTDQTFTWAARFNEAPEHFIFNNCLRDPIGRAMCTDALQILAARWEGLGLDEQALAAYASVASESQGIDDVRGFIVSRLQEHKAWAESLPNSPRSLVVKRGGPQGKRWVDVSWRPAVYSPTALGVIAYALEYRSEGGHWRRIYLGRTERKMRLSNLPLGNYEVRLRAVGWQGVSLPVTSRVIVR